MEEAKLRLSSVHSTKITIDLEGGEKFVTELTRKKFEDLVEPLLQKALLPLRIVLKDAAVNREEVGEIVLVGGSTRIPKLRYMIDGFFDGQVHLNTEINPDEAVGRGVAIQAGILGGAWPLEVSATEIDINLRKIELD